DGIETSPYFLPMRRVLPVATLRGKCSTCSRKIFRGSLADRRTLVLSTRLSSPIQGQEIFRSTLRKEKRYTLAFVSTRWLQSSMDSHYPRCEHLARVSSYLAIMRALGFV